MYHIYHHYRGSKSRHHKFPFTNKLPSMHRKKFWLVFWFKSGRSQAYLIFLMIYLSLLYCYHMNSIKIKNKSNKYDARWRFYKKYSIAYKILSTKNECDAWFETRQFFLSINQSLISYWQNLIQGCFQLYFSNGSKLLENFCQNNEPDFRNGSQRRIEEHSTKGKPKFCPWYWK